MHNDEDGVYVTRVLGTRVEFWKNGLYGRSGLMQFFNKKVNLVFYNL